MVGPCLAKSLRHRRAPDSTGTGFRQEPLPTHRPVHDQTWLSPPPLLSSVAPQDLEDRDADDSWTVGSRPQQEKYPSGSRVGAFAAAAGRGATAFVEAFRSAMGAHRTSYSSRRSTAN